MSRVCEVTGKKAITGHTVSHSNIKTNRKFQPNLQKKRFFVTEENRWVELKVSTSAIRTINKNGISAVLRDMAKKKKIAQEKKDGIRVTTFKPAKSQKLAAIS